MRPPAGKRGNTTPAPPPQATLAPDVVPGEGGEPDSTSTDTSAADPYSGGDYDSYEPDYGGRGGIQGTATLNLEVSLLSIAAVDRIGAEIARRVAPCAAKHGLTTLVLSNSELIEALQFRSVIAAELAVLAQALPTSADAADSGSASFAGAAVAEAMSSARRAAQSAASALSSFAISTRYSGRRNTVGARPLEAALAKHLAAAGLKILLPAHALPGAGAGDLLGRMLALRERFRRAADEGNAAAAEIAALLDRMTVMIFGGGAEQGGGNPLLARQLLLADRIAPSLDATTGSLLAEITASGGSYRARRWLFNFLTGSDGLTYNGGAAVTYFLLPAQQQHALASDTLYFATPHGRFRSSGAAPSPSNLDPTPAD